MDCFRNYTGFVQYDGRRFLQRIPHSPEQSYLGILGPLIVVEVGQTLKIVIKNKARRGYTVSPNGVRIHKRNEGAIYNDGAGEYF